MKGLIWLIAIFLVMMVISPVMVEAELVPITRLGMAPWLGKLKDEKDLLDKFKGDKPNFVKFIQYDLKKAVDLEITSVEAIKIVDAMESAIKKGVKKMYFPDGTVFKSMGWKSRKTGKLMMTPNPVLRLGRKVEGFLIKVAFKNYDIEYVFLRDCGNLCLKDVKKEEIPPKAKVLPPAPPVEAPSLLLPKAEALPQKCPEQKTVIYVYVTVPTAPATIPVGYIPPPPPFVFREPIYYSSPSVSVWSSGGISRPYYHHRHHRPHSHVRPPRVRTVPPAATIRPPTVRTVPPASSPGGTVSPPGVTTR